MCKKWFPKQIENQKVKLRDHIQLGAKKSSFLKPLFAEKKLMLTIKSL